MRYVFHSLLRRQMSEKGQSMVQAMVGGGFLAVSLMLAAKASQISLETQAEAFEKYSAQQSASELLEFFESLSNAQLKTYLSQNPMTGNVADAYGLCNEVNALIRYPKPKIVYPDPIGDISKSDLEKFRSSAAVNRYYRVQVVDRRTLIPNSFLCGKTVNQITLASYEGFLVTVGVTYPSRSRKSIKRVVLSSLLQER